jgi:hypothetical protein
MLDAGFSFKRSTREGERRSEMRGRGSEGLLIAVSILPTIDLRSKVVLAFQLLELVLFRSV